ncbi:MAG: hypothetical protein IT220_03785 [Flavobacteriaceae bacterium]|nr:hypothetical protein [Flavobacteriaceae bacterium]
MESLGLYTVALYDIDGSFVLEFLRNDGDLSLPKNLPTPDYTIQVT